MFTLTPLSFTEKQKVISLFPSFKLCYEKIIHNKVNNINNNSVLEVAIPYGKKCFIWFTLYNCNPTCLYIERGKDRVSIENVYILPCSFSPSIIGTILSGSIVENKNMRFIVIDDVYTYKNRFISHILESYDKIKLVCDLFLDDKIKNISELKTQFMIAPFSINNNVMKYISGNIKYYCIQYRKNNTLYENILLKDIDIRNINSNNSNNSNNIITFNVVPEIQNDIYTLFTSNNVEVGKACIPTYELSVMMNKLFRNIKENINLDYLEESDSESEFEDTSKDKFILNKNLPIKMDCVYNLKFKKWQPIKNNNNGYVIHSNDLPCV